MWLEEKCEDLEQKLKKVTNEKYKEIQVLQVERKELEEKYEGQEQDLKEVTNEKSMEIQDKLGIKDYFKLLTIIDLNAAAVSKMAELLSMDKPHLSKGITVLGTHYY